MSFYLALESHPGNAPLDPESADRVLRKVPHMTGRMVQGGREYLYENPRTGVHFAFDLQPPHLAGSGHREDEASLSFHINLARPSFFALEAMPVVAGVAEDLNLLIVDPQNDGITPRAPLEMVTADLVRSWQQSNKWAVGVLRSKQGVSLAHYAQEKATYCWSWAYLLPEILRKYAGSGVYIPRIFALRRRESRRVFTAIAWTQQVSELLIPAVDGVIITRRARRGLGGSSLIEEGMVSRYAALNCLDFGLTRVEDPVPHWHYTDTRGSRARRLAAIAQLPLMSTAALRVVSPDGFVDVSPSSSPSIRRELTASISMN